MLTLTLKKYLKQFFTLIPTRDATANPKVSFILSLGILVTQVSDYLTTKLGLTVAGASEANSIMGRFINQYGWDAFLSLKLAASAFLIWTCWKRPLVASAIVVLYAGVVLNNLVAILVHLG